MQPLPPSLQQPLTCLHASPSPHTLHTDIGLSLYKHRSAPVNPAFKATQTPRCLSRPESQLPGLSLEAPPSPPWACHLCPSHTGPRSFPTHTHLPTAAPSAAAACSPTTPPAAACHASWYHPQISKSSACVTFSEILPGSSRSLLCISLSLYSEP